MSNKVRCLSSQNMNRPAAEHAKLTLMGSVTVNYKSTIVHPNHVVGVNTLAIAIIVHNPE